MTFSIAAVGPWTGAGGVAAQSKFAAEAVAALTDADGGDEARLLAAVRQGLQRYDRP
ncbi:hypothetical protein [Halobaculum litoreum]|uniref:Uncharacterized protein n=1 Tax=Halobaculum litoreum TaxID=3031998 RepID=A0ABD5XUZ3_9EURY|nr:hypothetical protein [Halobaculum sp. DT92]